MMKLNTLKTAGVVGLALAALHAAPLTHAQKNTPQTVDSVDLERYVGTWREVARLPMFFQRNCARQVTASYQIIGDGKISVTNRCLNSKGKLIEAKGVATTVNQAGSKLKVSFLPSWLQWLPVGKGDYWVLALEEDYTVALVGTPDRDTLWLLTKRSTLSNETKQKYLSIAADQGFNLTELIQTAP